MTHHKTEKKRKKKQSSEFLFSYMHAFGIFSLAFESHVLHIYGINS